MRKDKREEKKTTERDEKLNRKKYTRYKEMRGKKADTKAFIFIRRIHIETNTNSNAYGLPSSA